MTVLLDRLAILEGLDLSVNYYIRLDELEYGFATADSKKFPKTPLGRDQFLQHHMKQHNVGFKWEDEKFPK